MIAPLPAGRRGLLDRRGAVRGQRGPEGDLDPAGLEVVGRAGVLDERRPVVEVAGVALLDGRGALAGVVALVGHRVAQRHVATVGGLADPAAHLRHGWDRRRQRQRYDRRQRYQLLQPLLPPPNKGLLIAPVILPSIALTV